jgi:hypothetical protein
MGWKSDLKNNPSIRTMALVLTQLLKRNEYQEAFWGEGGG